VDINALVDRRSLDDALGVLGRRPPPRRLSPARCAALTRPYWFARNARACCSSGRWASACAAKSRRAVWYVRAFSRSPRRYGSSAPPDRRRDAQCRVKRSEGFAALARRW